MIEKRRRAHRTRDGVLSRWLMGMRHAGSGCLRRRGRPSSLAADATDATRCSSAARKNAAADCCLNRFWNGHGRMKPKRLTKIARSDVNESVWPARNPSTTVSIRRSAVARRCRGLYPGDF